MNIASLKTSLLAWITSVVGAGVVGVWDEVNGPRPGLVYVRLKFIAGPIKVGSIDELVDAETQDQFSIVERRMLTLSVNVYGTGALQYASDLLTSLSKSSVIDTLEAAGIVTNSEGPVRDISQLLQTAFEPRAQFDVQISVTSEITDTPGEIDEVTVTSTVAQGDGSHSHDSEITVSID